jgi:hypothetical protein
MFLDFQAALYIRFTRKFSKHQKLPKDRVVKIKNCTVVCPDPVDGSLCPNFKTKIDIQKGPISSGILLGPKM